MERIHLIPPKYRPFSTTPAVAIINGYYIVPIRTAWYILLYHYIEEVTATGKKKFNNDDIKNIIDRTVIKTKQVYKFTDEKLFKKDLALILETLKGITSKNKEKYKTDYYSIKQYSRYMTAPHRMDLMVSALEKDGKWNCTNCCVNCYAAGQHYSGCKELNTSEWKKAIDICQKNHIPQITFTGGEPTMREDLVELIEYSSWFVTRLNTNGTLLSEELCGKLKKASLDNVQITLYSYDEKIHNRLVGAETFELTVQGIKNAIKTGLDISINTPLCSLNSDYIKTLEFLSLNGIKYVTCSGIIQSGNATDSQAEKYYISESDLKGVLKNAKNYCNAHNMEINFTLPGCLSDNFLKEARYTPPLCGACLSNMAIAPDGTVMPCQSWLDKHSKLGNILNDSWLSIWKHPLCRKIRRKKEKELSKCLITERRKRNEKI